MTGGPDDWRAEQLAGAYSGRRVLVAGAGVTGRSVAKALRHMGSEVTVTDGNAERLAELTDTGAELAAGLTTPPDGVDLVVTSPGWRPSSPVLVAAAEAGIEVIGEVELACRISAMLTEPPVWLAVTGTNGKTTTVGMLDVILRAAGVDAIACGNIGLPVTDAVLAGHAVLAVELSSFQLYWQTSLRTTASVLLNLADDHLDWHGTGEEYAAAKARIFDGATTGVYNADDPASVHIGQSHGARASFTLGEPGEHRWGVRDGWLADDEPLCPTAEVNPPGPHNVGNALAAAALARLHGVPAEAVRQGLRAYRPEPHRAQLVEEIGGVRYVNDSKATNPHAATGSVLAHDSVVWIAGGQLKGAEVDELVTTVADRLRGVVLIGQDADVISAALARHAPDVPVHTVESRDHGAMETAVYAAATMARPGDVVLLAPAAASWDMFRNYPHRGEAFEAAVRTLPGAP
ncbi:UDP-N-acetylmuramoylalanine--D-glutamate ligase [Herbihabitans rhizosphaerae]|uniref:UDP-N-acetylmuramoylalanine--D-glutamate ligase n=1 Tax=Herbihabitans rhizosphaerae TaxID=1872711 RepID=A0A4Q7KHN9_9PSEU|nr:UDP-N-acetylmuramoyl-L-alanine--D-glutamate ligase [Herbihabitans rhizosphaerae]RZS34802.1 UDP-N-acetylmuramoylalanine--D-glutamate ligase [Herbihabitans rhizosphaerae]